MINSYQYPGYESAAAACTGKAILGLILMIPFRDWVGITIISSQNIFCTGALRRRVD